jgi:hypothetical protein
VGVVQDTSFSWATPIPGCAGVTTDQRCPSAGHPPIGAAGGRRVAYTGLVVPLDRHWRVPYRCP